MKIAALQSRLDKLPGFARIGLILGGYAAALVAAVLAIFVYASMTSGPDRDASSGMYAFADALIFVLVFSAGSIAPTGLLLYFLRAFAAPWRIFSSVGLAVSITGLFAAMSIAQQDLASGAWSMLAAPRVLVAPLLAGSFVFVGMFSPSRPCQRWLFTAAVVECLTSAYGFIHWVLPLLAA